jgi:hypothetical protein
LYNDSAVAGAAEWTAFFCSTTRDEQQQTIDGLLIRTALAGRRRCCRLPVLLTR